MKIAEALNLRGDPDSYERQEAMWLLEHIVQVGALELKFRLEQSLTEAQTQQYLAGLQRLEQGEPLAYVTGSQPFWTLDLKATSDTLVPRPDTEILVDTVLNLELPEQCSMVDLGTGTGAIALALASERPRWQVLATDIYFPTLQVAQENAERHHLQQVRFACGAWFDAIPAQKFDLIVSNPPYIDPEDVHLQQLGAEPQRALIAQQKGLADLKIIIEQAVNWLNPKGWVVLEHGYDQGVAVREIFSQAGFSQIRTVQDYGKNDRVTLAQWKNKKN
ncbi:protein-(glutamine-N5) methyltransferase, release factor-specific [Acinetobacter brisouii CIP 110357]|uniref:Release factor glutamine methyltransferase n=1 Tax=Acinetobacter brisouii CIP 110357 TaxID=1341683 RepID=V2URV3_9GAMM|nr:peptide chain release factor N(5)-glutamine methyltransferase [Acinetobacter brisouii]ENV46759.1 protein-(glutamine-N5) methyltransferase, release factor-specific [Acinetobacter brisouii ANC 4119]ESK52747.1 protein-(glutamine-N5) methyltransferase, release factor-specific [Acinetobacter brisouii CIP 110357]